MSTISFRTLSLVLATVVLALPVGGCEKEEQDKGCGNGLLGIGEDCDCGTDPDNLPDGCSAINGAPGGNCGEDCRLLVHENCDNHGIDDDGDGLADCDDPDCAQYPTCIPESPCNDLIDNDGDGVIDCDDEDCADLPVCGPEDCINGEDDNEDGFTDCQDAQCIGHEACEGVEVCWNSIDDDGDGYADCDDEQCVSETVCNPEDCTNGLDDDGDLKIDCADRYCIEKDDCALTDCGQDDVNETISLSFDPGGKVAWVSRDVSAETDDHYGQCDVSNGKEFVLAINLLDSGQLRVSFEQSGDHNFGLYLKGGPNAGCTAAVDRCTYPDMDAGGLLDYGVLPVSKYFLIVSEGVAGLGGLVNLVITLADPLHPEELCDNLLDDDQNNQTDCGDLECFERAGVCDHTDCEDTALIPEPDEEIGMLGPSTNSMFPMPSNDPQDLTYLPLDTRGAGADLPVTKCQGLMGAETLVHFTLTEEAIIQVGFEQNIEDAGDHVFALFFKGSGCELAEHACIDTVGTLHGQVQFPGDPDNDDRYPPGEYYLAVKALGSVGRINIQIITMTTLEEICEDGGYDNDGDGDANCDDTDCAAHHVCIMEDCSDPTADLDEDDLYGCDDDDLDDLCACAFPCAPGDPRDHVCDGIYDDEVRDFGLVYPPASLVLDVDTSLSTVTDNYEVVDCHGSAGAPDFVYFFTLPYQADVYFQFTQPPGSDHSGLLMYADRCRACDDQGLADEHYIYCYANASPWAQNNLEAGSYALILTAMPHPISGLIMSGQFNGFLVINP